MSTLVLKFESDEEKDEFMLAFCQMYQSSVPGAAELEDLDEKFSLVFENYTLETIKQLRKELEAMAINAQIDSEFELKKQQRENERKER